MSRYFLFFTLIAAAAASPQGGALGGASATPAESAIYEDRNAAFDDSLWQPVLEKLKRRWLLRDEEVKRIKEILLEQMRQVKAVRMDLALSAAERTARERSLLRSSRSKILAIIVDPERLRKLSPTGALGNTPSTGSGPAKTGAVSY